MNAPVRPTSHGYSDSEIIHALRDFARLKGSVTIKGVAACMGCSDDALRRRLRAAVLREQLACLDPVAANLLEQCLDRCDRRGGASRPKAPHVAQSRDALLHAVQDGTPLPEDWYGPGLPPTENAGRDAPPGSEARIELYTRRAARGEALFSSADYPAAREVDAPAPSQQVSTAAVDGMSFNRVHHRAQMMGAA